MRRGPFLRLGESLFPEASPGPSRFTRGEGIAVALALLALAIVAQLARIGWSASLNSLWAEDGPIYLQEALRQDLWHAVSSTYATYLVVVPRLIAEGAALVPLEDAAAATSVLSAAVVALSGFFVWRAAAGHIHDPYLRGALAVTAVLVPVAGLESVDTAAYVPWYMLFASFWILLWRPRTTLAAGLGGLFLLATGLSSPGVWFFLPLAVLRAASVRDRRDLILLAGFAAGAAIQVPVLALNDETAVEPLWTGDIWTVYLQRVVDGAPLGLRLGGVAWAQLGWPLLTALLAAAAAGLWAGAKRASRGARWLAAIAIPTSLVMFVVSLYQRAVGTEMLWPAGVHNGTGSRYAIVPALLLVSAAVALIDSSLRARPAGARRLAPASAATIAILLGAVLSSFWVRNIEVRGAPPWDAALKAGATSCAREGVDDVAVPTSPPGFGMQIECDRLLDAYPMPRDAASGRPSPSASPSPAAATAGAPRQAGSPAASSSRPAPLRSAPGTRRSRSAAG
jgi:hypothetical protein